MGVAMLVFFTQVMRWPTDLPWPLNLGAIIISHISFSFSFVAIVVRGRLASFNRELEEAAKDLGAGEWRDLPRRAHPAHAPGPDRRRPARLHPQPRRLRHHLLHLGSRHDHFPGQGLFHGALLGDAGGQRRLDHPHRSPSPPSPCACRGPTSPRPRPVMMASCASACRRRASSPSFPPPGASSRPERERQTGTQRRRAGDVFEAASGVPGLAAAPGSRDKPATRPFRDDALWGRVRWSGHERQPQPDHPLRECQQALRQGRRRRRCQPFDRRGRVLRPAGALRLRQDHPAADARRLRDADRRPHPDRRRGRQPHAAEPAAGEHGLPVLCRLSAHERRRQCRLWPEGRPGGGGRARRAGSRRRWLSSSSRASAAASPTSCPAVSASAWPSPGR